MGAEEVTEEVEATKVVLLIQLKAQGDDPPEIVKAILSAEEPLKVLWQFTRQLSDGAAKTRHHHAVAKSYGLTVSLAGATHGEVRVDKGKATQAVPLITKCPVKVPKPTPPFAEVCGADIVKRDRTKKEWGLYRCAAGHLFKPEDNGHDDDEESRPRATGIPSDRPSKSPSQS